MFVLTAIIAFVVAILLGALVFRVSSAKENIVYGATFSTLYAEHLELDWRESFTRSLDDLGIRHYRIPVYWSEVEKKKGVYDFNEVDWIMNEAQVRGAKVTLVVGMKVPRWPECFVPIWAEKESDDVFKDSLLQMIGVTVDRYKDHPALERWQVENEPFFPFGHCPKPNTDRFFEEIDLVREKDPGHLIQRTTSGEQSLWLLHTRGADVVGASLYRTVFNPVIGYFVFPIPPAFYALQAASINPFVEKVIISELQAEPWLPPGVDGKTAEEKYKLFDSADLRQHIRYANKTGADEIFLWGIEWWDHLRAQGETRLWDEGRNVFSQ